jgi:hypothetical protein
MAGVESLGSMKLNLADTFAVEVKVDTHRQVSTDIAGKMNEHNLLLSKVSGLREVSDFPQARQYSILLRVPLCLLEDLVEISQGALCTNRLPRRVFLNRDHQKRH